MALSQAQMDRVARSGERMLGGLMEAITYYAKSGPSAALVAYANIQAHFEEFTLHELGAVVGSSEIVRTDRKCRIATSRVVWTPTQYDELTRADGTRWMVLAEGDGTGRPWTILPTRQVA